MRRTVITARGEDMMNAQKAKKLRRIEMAHDRFIGVMLAVGMPPSRPTLGVDVPLWHDYDYRVAVENFYIASFASTPRPNVKTVKKFVRSYIRWGRRQHDAKVREYYDGDS